MIMPRKNVPNISLKMGLDNVCYGTKGVEHFPVQFVDYCYETLTGLILRLYLCKIYGEALKKQNS